MGKLKQLTRYFYILSILLLNVKLQSHTIEFEAIDLDATIPFCLSSYMPELEIIPFFKPVAYEFKPFEYKLSATGNDPYLNTLSTYLNRNKDSRIELLSYSSDSHKIAINNQLSKLRFTTMISKLKSFNIEEDRISIYNLASTTDIFNMHNCVVLKIY